jgi:hypothetical protein
MPNMRGISAPKALVGVLSFATFLGFGANRLDSKLTPIEIAIPINTLKVTSPPLYLLQLN